MSTLDKVIAAITPPEREKARVEARQKAQAAAGADSWLALVLEHHRRIEAAFAEVRNASEMDAQRAAQRQLAVILTGHSIAEEAVLYPALVKADKTSHSTHAFTEQAATKVQMGLLEDLQPLSRDYLDKLEHIRGAVAHHMYEEEGTWFLELRDKLPPQAQARMTQRYAEEFARYVDGSGQPSSGTATFRRNGVDSNSSAESH